MCYWKVNPTLLKIRGRGRNGLKVFLDGKEQYPPPNCDQSPIFKTKAVCCLPHGHILAHLSGQKCPQLTHVDFNKWLDPSLSPRSDVSSPDVFVMSRAHLLTFCHNHTTTIWIFFQHHRCSSSHISRRGIIQSRRKSCPLFRGTNACIDVI